MIETYKIFTRKVNLEKNLFFKPPVTRKTRQHNMKIFKERSRLDLRKRYFSQRVTDEWSSLPTTVVNSQSVLQFKCRYDTQRGSDVAPEVR